MKRILTLLMLSVTFSCMAQQSNSSDIDYTQRLGASRIFNLPYAGTLPTTGFNPGSLRFYPTVGKLAFWNTTWQYLLSEVNAAALYTPLIRTLTINGTTQNFSQNLSFTIPTADLSNYYTKAQSDGLYKPIGYQPTWENITGKPTFSQVAFDGDYNSLINKPSAITNYVNTTGDQSNILGAKQWIGTQYLLADIGSPGFGLVGIRGTNLNNATYALNFTQSNDDNSETTYNGRLVFYNRRSSDNTQKGAVIITGKNLNGNYNQEFTNGSGKILTTATLVAGTGVTITPSITGLEDRLTIASTGTTVIVDPTPTNGSTNAVSSGGTFTALGLKADDANVLHKTLNETKSGTLSLITPNVASGTSSLNSLVPLVVTGGNGGENTLATGTAVAGNAADINITGGSGGNVFNTTGTAVSGRGSTIKILAGDGGIIGGTATTKSNGEGGGTVIQAGSSYGNAAGGNTEIKAGNNLTGSSGFSGGNVYITNGWGNGTSVSNPLYDGTTFIGVSASNVVRGNTVIGNTFDDRQNRLQVTGNSLFTGKVKVTEAPVDPTDVVRLQDLSSSETLQSVTTRNNKTNVSILTGDATVTSGLSYLGGGSPAGIVGSFTNHPFDIYTNGAQVARFLTNGNVGIGTTSPVSKLQINTTAENAIPALGTVNAKMYLSNGNAYGTQFGVLNTGDGFIQQQRSDNGSEVYRLLLNPNGGNVGIGTTTVPEKLTVAGNVSASTATAPTHLTTKSQMDAADALKQNLVTLTTTGTGAATLNVGTGALNIPTPVIPTDYVNTTSNQTGILGNKTWSGVQTINNQVYQVESGKTVALTNGTILAQDPSTNRYAQFGVGGMTLTTNTTTGAPANLYADNLTVTRDFQFPNASGTLALVSQIPVNAIVEISGTSQAMSVSTTYIPHNASLTTLTLPTVNPAIGSLITILGEGAGGFRIAQNASQFIVSGNATTTVGTAGYVQSTSNNTTISLRYVNTNKWMVSSSNSTPLIN